MKSELANMDAVILAGGLNRRFNGAQKSLAFFNGKPILDHQLGVLNRLFQNIYLITNQKEDFSAYSQLVKVEDIIRKKGPLSGIHAGLSYSNKDYIFVFACDMPFLEIKIIEDQVARLNSRKWDAVVPQTPKSTEPLHGIYSRQITKKLEGLLNKPENYAVNHFLRKIQTYYWPVSYQKAFMNINSQQALTHYEDHTHYPHKKRK